MKNAIQVIGLFLFLVSAANAASLQKVSNTQLPAIQYQGDAALLKTAIERQLAQCKTENAKDTFMFGTNKITRAQWCTKTGDKLIQLLKKFPKPDDFWREVKKGFVWYQSTGSDGAGAVKYTSYYFPSLDAKKTPDSTFKFPLYTKPSDLVAGTPYYTHQEITEKQLLAGKGLEIAYVNDYYDAFIFHVQGAGAIQVLDEGPTPVRKILNYASGNGHKYVSVGKILRDEYSLPDTKLNLKGMKEWFAQNPDKLYEVLFRNPSYIFFQVDADGPYGVKNIILTPRHSIATDHTQFPLGAVGLVVTEIPSVDAAGNTTWTPYASLAVNQDVGGAIKGAGRVDLYWGEGKQAEETAGNMNRGGKLFFLVAK